MTEFFTTLLNFVDMIVDVVSNFVSGIGTMLSFISNAVNTIGLVISRMPTELTAFAAAFISISVAYLIIGR